MTIEQGGQFAQETGTQFERLNQTLGHIWEIATKLGLDPYPTHFELVPPHIMYEVGSYGIPGRFSHWTHGKAYHQIKTMYDYGLSRIYELVVNNNPAYAFLLENNTTLQNILVAAHVLAHTDFFKNNLGFRDTDRRMAETAPLHAARIRQYEFDHGRQEVEEFLDAVLAIQQNIDPVSLVRPTREVYEAEAEKRFRDMQRTQKEGRKTGYEDLLELGKPKQEEPKKTRVPIPIEEEQDLLYFIAAFSPRPLEDWQKDIIGIVRSEMQYFLPQTKTKIMNEGWATYWHRRILTELENRGLLTGGEPVEWRSMHSGVTSPHPRRINPYYIGWKIWEYINRIYEGRPHPDNKKIKTWWGEDIDQLKFKGQDRYNPLWVRENVASDAEFLREYLAGYLVEELDLYTYEFDKKENAWKITEKDPQRVRDNLIRSMTNFGEPVIKVAVGGRDYNGNGELYLVHKCGEKEEQNLDIAWAEKTLRYIYELWGRSVHLETIIGGERTLLSCSFKGENPEVSRTKLTA